MKVDVKELTRLIALKRGKILEHIDAVADVKGLLSTPLEKSLYLSAGEGFQRAMEKFKQTQKELSQEIEKSTSSLGEQIEKLKKQAEKTKKDKSTLAGKISECIASGQNPEDLYANIYKVSLEVHNLEDTIRVLEREKQYPSNSRIEKLGAALFNDFVELLAEYTQFNRGLEALNKKIGFIYDILNSYTCQLNVLRASFASAEKFGIQSYCFFNREAIQMTWGDLERAAWAEIDRRLAGVSSLKAGDK